MSDEYDDLDFDFEDDEEFLAAWAAADRHAALVLVEALPEVMREEAPRDQLQRAAASIRGGVATGRWPFSYFAAACGWKGELPGHDPVLWLEAAVATISPHHDPGTDPEDQSAVAALEHADWLAIVVGIVRRGVGAAFEAEAVLADLAAMPEIEDSSEDPEDDLSFLEHATAVLSPLWQAIGVLDRDDRLTALGRWGLPQALWIAWSTDEAPVDRLDETETAIALGILAKGPLTREELRRALAKESVFVDEEKLSRSLMWRHEIYQFDDGSVGHLPTLAEGLVLTHRVSAGELEIGVLDAGVDLGLFGLVALDGVPFAGGGTLKARFEHDGLPLPADSSAGLAGPHGWLEGCEAGELLALRYIGGQVALERVGLTEPDETETGWIAETAQTLARAVDGDETDFPGVTCAEIVLTVRRQHPRGLTRPLAPLSEVVLAAGLETLGADVGVPGTAWYGEPSWLTDEQRTAYHSWRDVLRTRRVSGSLPSTLELMTLAASLQEIVLDLAANDVIADEQAEPVLEAMAAATTGPLRAVPLYLLARDAEARGDGPTWLRLLEESVAADPTRVEALGDLADLRAISGDAREAQRLYALAAVDPQTPEVQVLRTFLQPPEGDVGRNRPCPCGSGKKYKLCHGRTALHPLDARAHWLWVKSMSFLQRGANREVLLDWAEIASGAPREDRQTVIKAIADPVTQDFAAFDGGLLERFIDVLGPLLPEDERSLAESWLASDRRLMEVLRVTPMRGVRVKDLLTGEEFDVLDRRLTTEVKPRDLILGRPLPDGGARSGSRPTR